MKPDEPVASGLQHLPDGLDGVRSDLDDYPPRRPVAFAIERLSEMRVELLSVRSRFTGRRGVGPNTRNQHTNRDHQRGQPEANDRQGYPRSFHSRTLYSEWPEFVLRRHDHS